MAPSTTSGIDTDELSDEVRPQDDLFRHVNSRWLAAIRYVNFTAVRCFV